MDSLADPDQLQLKSSFQNLTNDRVFVNEQGLLSVRDSKTTEPSTSSTSSSARALGQAAMSSEDDAFEHKQDHDLHNNNNNKEEGMEKFMLTRVSNADSSSDANNTGVMPNRHFHPEDCRDWSIDDVIEWAGEFIADRRVLEILKRECIDGPALISYTVQEMKEDGFPRGVAKQLHAAIHRLVHVRVSLVEQSVSDLQHIVRMLRSEMTTIRAALNLDRAAREFLWHPQLRNPLLLPLANGRVVFDCGLRDRDREANEMVGTWKTILGDVVWKTGCHYYEVMLSRCASGSLLIGAVPENYTKFEWGISSRSPGISWYPYFSKPDNLRIKACKQNSYGYIKDINSNVTPGARLGVKIDMDKQLVQFFRDGVRAAEPLYVPIALNSPIRPAVSMYYPQDSVSTLFSSQLTQQKLVFLAGVNKKQNPPCALHSVLGKSYIKDFNVISIIFQFFDVFQLPCEF